jgi:hypothetical protein
MKPIAILIFALVARVLWAFPLWVTYATCGALAAWALGYELHHRRKIRRFAEDNPLPVDPPTWVPCPVRSQLHGGTYFMCAERAGHEGHHTNGDRLWD